MSSFAQEFPSELVDVLNSEQRAAVLHGRGPCLILAGAGSGKTRVLTHRVAGLISMGIPAHQILALTFTNKAAREMKERVVEMLAKSDRVEEITPSQLTLTTFHAFGAIYLRQYADQLSRTQNFVIYDKEDQQKLLREVVAKHNIALERDEFADLYEAIQRAKNKGLKGSDIGTLCGMSLLERTQRDRRVNPAQLGDAYEHALQRADAFDFGDLILFCVKLFEEHKDIREIYQKNFKYILVDEFQDTNFIQNKWLNLLVNEKKTFVVWVMMINLFIAGEEQKLKIF